MDYDKRVETLEGILRRMDGRGVIWYSEARGYELHDYTDNTPRECGMCDLIIIDDVRVGRYILAGDGTEMTLDELAEYIADWTDSWMDDWADAQEMIKKDEEDMYYVG